MNPILQILLILIAGCALFAAITGVVTFVTWCCITIYQRWQEAMFWTEIK